MILECPFCPSEIHTIWHLFIECSQANSFWVEFQDWYGNHSGKKLHLSNLDTLYYSLFSILFSPKSSYHSRKILFIHQRQLVGDKLLLEKYIAINSGEQDKYVKRWDF